MVRFTMTKQALDVWLTVLLVLRAEGESLRAELCSVQKEKVYVQSSAAVEGSEIPGL